MRLILIFLVVLVYGCAPSHSDQKVAVSGETKGETVEQVAQPDTMPDEEYSEYATLFIVVADTGKDYYSLHPKMFTIHEALNLPVDTMGRYYNADKNLIALPDDDEDEMYAGDYFPRRFPTESLSLEYLSAYKTDGGEKTIALIAGMYESADEAEKARAAILPVEKKAFIIEAEVYMGCLH